MSATIIDINPERTAELKAHRDLLEPILRGLKDKIRTDLSSQAKSVLQSQIDVVQRRLNAVYAELAQIETTNMSHQALLDDGYPALIMDTIDQAIFDELQREDADEKAALAIFRVETMASTMTVNLGVAEDKP